VVNNAGILRDTIFHRMTPEEFDAVVKVHLYGAFYVSRAAIPFMRKQESGAFVHMTSTSGLIGNFGQANYSAAKLGIVGLSKSIALDMQKFGVRSNCIAPFAWTRMIDSIPITDIEQAKRVERLKALKPEKVAPCAVALLAGTVVVGIEKIMTRAELARSRHQLAQLDERLLRDIGIDRATARFEATKPFWS
jgi:NAD(P)-dependent dehydrogenase (short-subunit alcohol dehydrogenase family)